MNFIKIAWRDISSIFKNRFLRVSVTAIIVVPLLYSLLYLAAFWDPYTKLSSMPVAIVNEDKGTIKDGEKVNYGDDMVDSIKKNDKIGWRFVSLEEANKGLKGDDYYAIFVIPESFSKDIMSAKDGVPKQPEILYSANEKRNFLAAQINKNVMGELRTEVVKTISENYTKVTFDSLYEVKDGMKKAADGSKELADGMNTLNDNVPKMQDGVQKLYDGSGQLKDGIGMVKGKVDKATVVLSKYYPQIANLLSPEGVDSIKGIMNSADKLVNADTSMLSMVPELMTSENIALAKKTKDDIKQLNIENIVDEELTKQALSLMNDENKYKLQKLAKDASQLSAFEVDRIRPIMNLVGAPADNLINLVNNANKLYEGIDKQKLQPVLSLTSKSSDIFALMSDAKSLSSELATPESKKKLAPIMALMNEPNKTKIMTLVDDSQKLYASMNTPEVKAKIEPLMQLAKNKDQVITVMNNAIALNGKIDSTKLKPILDLAKDDATRNSMIKLMNDANGLASVVEKNKAQLDPLMKAYENKDKVLTLMNDANTLVTGLDKTKLEPLMKVMQNSDGLFTFVGDASKLAAYGNSDKLKPLMNLTTKQNQDTLNKLMVDSVKISKLDIDSMSKILTDQKNNSVKFIQGSSTLNKPENIAALKGAVNTNPNLTQDQKLSLNSLVDGYSKLTTETAKNMVDSAPELAKMENTLVELKAMQADLNNALALMDKVPDSMNYFNSTVMPQLVKVQQEFALLQPLLNGLPDSVKYVKGTLPQVQKIQTEYQAVAPLMNGVPQSIQYVDKLAGSAKTLYGQYQTVAPSIQGLPQSIQYANALVPQVRGFYDTGLKPMLPLMSKVPGSVEYVSTNILPTVKGLYGRYQTDALPLMKDVPVSIKYMASLEPKAMKLYTDYKTKIEPSINGADKSIEYAASLMPQVQNIAAQVKGNKSSIDAIKSVMTQQNMAYFNGVKNNLLTVKKDLDENSQNLATIKSMMAKLNIAMDNQTIDKIKAIQSDMENAKPIISKLDSQMTPENMAKLEQAPQLVTELTSMQKQLQNNGKLLEVAQSALTDGNVKMAQNVIAAIPQLTDGVNKLYNGSAQLKDGLGELNGKLPELADGSQKLTDGSKELNEKITEGSDKISSNLVNDSETMGKFVSKPVIMDEDPINPVKDYGTGFAPYFIPLSLWVGAIMMFFVITEKVDDDVEASSGAVVLGKFLSYAYIGILQAILASVVVLALGLKPANIALYILFNVFMSLVFIAIIQSLIFLLGQVGRLLAIVLLILQLTSCAGTFPLEVVPSFFKTLNPFMPFTYCVSALREAISGVDYAVFGKDVSILAGIMVAFLIISVLMKGHADKVQAKVRARKEEAMTV